MSTLPIRNVATIAHVDHGKTTLVDCLLKTCGIRTKDAIRVMDSIDQERERGITIRAKSAAVEYKGVRINLVDTPGHADFGGEVERAMGLVDGVLLLVDAAEGPMPQTRFVLRKALAAGAHPVVVINKVDRPDRRLDAVLDEIFDLFVSLDATDHQLDFTPIYTSAKEGWAQITPDGERFGMELLLDRILDTVPAPRVEEGPFTLQVANLHHDNFVGRVALGKVRSGSIISGAPLHRFSPEGTKESGRITRLLHYIGLEPESIQEATAGDIVEIAGFPMVNIGDTLTADPARTPLPALTVDEPTLNMLFRVNDGPLSNKDGKTLTSRELRARIEKEMLDNVGMRFEETERADTFRLSGRGLLHLSVFIETMRREGFEFLAGPPRVIRKGNLEPWEELVVEAPAESIGKVMELVGSRRGQIENMENKGLFSRLTAKIPSRGLIGLRTKVLNLSRGEATIVSTFREWGTWAGEIPTRHSGSLISMEAGTVNAYALDALNDRGQFFLEPGEEVYPGMVIGESNKEGDVDVNPCKARKVSNVRNSGADRALKFTPKRHMSLEDSLEFAAEDEFVEATPKFLRIRKDLLDAGARKRAGRTSSSAE
ncbi:MAG: GTP-binding protein [Planctomycetota bacterium]